MNSLKPPFDIITDATYKIFLFVLQFFSIVVVSLLGWAAVSATLVLIRYLSGLL